MIDYTNRRGTRTYSGVAAFALFVAALVFIALLVCAQAGILMLLLGAAHHEISKEIPALGFGACIIGALLLSTIGGLLRGSSGSNK